MLTIAIIATIFSLGLTIKCAIKKNFDGFTGWLTITIINAGSLIKMIS